MTIAHTASTAKNISFLDFAVFAVVRIDIKAASFPRLYNFYLFLHPRLPRAVKLRRTLLTALLALMLLLSQQLGHMHAMSHLADGGANPAHSKQLPVEKICELCLAFSAVGTALTGPAHTLPVFAASYPLAVVAAPQFPALARVTAFHSRAPPAIL